MNNKKLSIVYVCAEYPFRGRKTGGYGRYVESISLGMKRLGHEVAIICAGSENEILIDQGRKIIVLRLPGIDSKSNKKKPLFKRIISFIAYPILFSWLSALKIRELSKSMKVDIVEGSEFAGEMLFPLIMSKLKNTKIILKLHTSSFIIRKYNHEPETIFYIIVGLLEKFVLNHADYVYAPSEYIARVTAKETNVKITLYIPNPIEVKKYINKKKSLLRAQNTILYVGKLQTKKGVFLLAKSIPLVVKRIPNAKFIFIGPDTIENDLSVKERLYTWLQKSGSLNKVQFMSPIPLKELAYYYQQAAITVVPSVWDSFSYTVLEASIFESVALANAAGGINDILKNGIGVQIESMQSNKLAEQIVFLLKNPKKLKKTVSQSRLIASKNYNLLHISKETEKFYYNILNT